MILVKTETTKTSVLLTYAGYTPENRTAVEQLAKRAELNVTLTELNHGVLLVRFDLSGFVRHSDLQTAAFNAVQCFHVGVLEMERIDIAEVEAAVGRAIKYAENYVNRKYGHAGSEDED